MKKYVYIAAFILAGMSFFGFLSLLLGLMLFELYAKGMMTHPLTVCIGVIESIALVLMTAGGLLGLWGGRHFWPILYDENGEVRFHNWREWKRFRARLHKKRESDSLNRHEKS